VTAASWSRHDAAIALLRSLIVDGCVPAGSSDARTGLHVGDLDDKSRALVGLAALIASGGGPCSYRRCVQRALAAGACDGEILEVLIEVAPTIGLCRLASATTEFASALGYDIDRALELWDPPNRHQR
jgi:4-carboxymuconolactone decarboxylase